MTTHLMTALLVVANVLGGGMAFPQAVRLWRTRSVEGISGVWAGVSILMNLWWLAYGLVNQLWGLVPVSVSAVVLYSVIASVYLREVGRRAVRELAVGALGLGLVPLPFLLLGGWDLAGLVIGINYGLQLAPAVVASLRRRDLSGIAPATWIAAWVESAIWFVYGLVVVDVALLSGGGSGVVMATIILIRLVVTGHRPFRLPRRPRLAYT